MVECDNCGDDVFRVWRLRERSESMTHRTVDWVCEECHPELGPIEHIDPSTSQATTDSGRAGSD